MIINRNTYSSSYYKNISVIRKIAMLKLAMFKSLSEILSLPLAKDEVFDEILKSNLHKRCFRLSLPSLIDEYLTNPSSDIINLGNSDLELKTNRLTFLKLFVMELLK